jgi:uncharacterized membrane protein
LPSDIDLAILGATRCLSQTASAGALIGQVLDPAGKGIAHVFVEAKKEDMAANRSTVSDDEGRFALSLVPPGTYQITAAMSGYSQEQSIQVSVPVTETIPLSIPTVWYSRYGQSFSERRSASTNIA